MQKRKSIRNDPRDDYEFEMVDGDEEGLNGVITEAGVGKRRKRRAGELYDAFAGESDEDLYSEGEGEGVSGDEDEDDEPYRDAPPAVGREQGKQAGKREA